MFYFIHGSGASIVSVHVSIAIWSTALEIDDDDSQIGKWKSLYGQIIEKPIGNDYIYDIL